MRTLLTCLLLAFCCAVKAQPVTAISPNQAYQGQSFATIISSSGLFLIGSSPQGNIQDILLKNANDSVFAVSDSINVIDVNTVRTFWNTPANIVTGLYSLVVRVYDNLFPGATKDYTLGNAFMINVPQPMISPNPFEQSTIISFNNPSNDKYVLTLYDVAGNIINTITGSGSEFQIEKGNMASGVYIYKLTNQNTKLSAQGNVSVL
ncbi:MAG: hypothetical protein JWO03_3480 [Bacteroidetes bacterium]|nr:hypothetical protein [Bacteroidota bacterium]